MSILENGRKFFSLSYVSEPEFPPCQVGVEHAVQDVDAVRTKTLQESRARFSFIDSVSQ